MGGKVGENSAALRAAVFSLSSKNLRGGRSNAPPPPSRARVKVFKTLRGEDVPQETRALFILRSAVSQRKTRATGLGRLHLRRPRLAATKRCFSYRAAAAWNRLSPETCNAGTVRVFKSMIASDHAL